MGGRWLVVLGVLVALLLALRLLRHEPGIEVGVTPEIAGTWTTDAPGYGDRYLEISSSEIAFGLGDEGESRHPVLGVRRVEGPGASSTYVVRYGFEDEGNAEGKLELLVAGPGLAIRSQPGIHWERRP